jgi:signal transduction histidine kinase/DNA-binding response OmpR family regulator
MNRQTGQFDAFFMKDGLPNDAVMAIEEDQRGNLWISTNDGLCQFNPVRREFRTFRQEDGLPASDFTKAAHQSPDGTLFFGSHRGLTVFHPNQIKLSNESFPVYITGLKLFNQQVVPGPESFLKQDVSDTKQITLKHDQSVLTLDFAAVLFQPHRNVRYAYRLDDFETNWNYVGAQRSATYTNLDPGTYRFMVKASLSDDFTHASEASLLITVLPPWYRTWWAYGFYACLVAGLLFLIRRMIQIREGYKTELRLEHLEAEKARELDRLRSSFFTNISHEFRTPLTLILTPLEQFLSESKSDDRRSQFKTMHQNANRLLRLINQLLDLAKLESGTLKPEISHHDIIDFIERITESFRSTAEKRQIQLRVTASRPTYKAYFDPDIVEKALFNLLANAMRFTPDGGTITVDGQINQPETQAAELVLTVRDTGAGIPDEHLSHIFDRFYQVNGQHQTKKAGTGIGLALSRELVELHKGCIDVTSQVNQGATFIIRLPIAESAFPAEWLAHRPSNLILNPESAPGESTEEATVNDPNASAPSTAPLLLIVEDHDDLRHYLVSSFRQTYRVIEAPNGQQALIQANKEVPDLIVSDWLMPDMDGVQLCEAIKADQATSHVPFILLTSRSSTESQLEGLTTGADDYVTKPFNVSLLQTRVANLLRSRQVLRDKFSKLIQLKPSDIVISSVEEQFIKKVLQLIEQNLANTNFDMHQLELELGMSGTQLYRKLKALTGKGGNELIRSIRLKRAAQLLQASGQTVSEIAFQVGFSDPNYFIRAFKKEFGCSPGEYGKQAVTA